MDWSSSFQLYNNTSLQGWQGDCKHGKAPSPYNIIYIICNILFIISYIILNSYPVV